MRRSGVFLVLCALVGAAVGSYVELSQASAYESTIRVFANTKKADNVPISQTTSLAIQRMESYVELADSSRMASRLVGRLDLDTTPEALARRISASLNKDTVIMTVTVGAATADEAEAITDVIPSEYTSLVNQLIDVPVSDPSATIFTTIDGPFVHKSSSLRGLALSSAFGVLVGSALGLAIAIAWARRREDHSPERLSALTELPVVGIVPRFDKAVDEHQWFAGMGEAQRLAFHRLARNLPHLLGPADRLVVVCAAERGAGSTAVSVGLAGALAERGRRVVLVDASFDTVGAAHALGLSTRHSITDVIDGAVELVDAIHSGSEEFDLDVLSYGPTHSGVITAQERRGLNAILGQLRAEYEVIIVDSAPLLERADLPTVVDRADAVLLVADRSTSHRETVAATEGLRAMGAGNAGVVVNRAAGRSTAQSQLLAGVVVAKAEREAV